ncbi:NADH-quinone oxidoreductase [Caldimicrobium thiodismutans]|jgi:NADH-quinone oxidoreductase subunit A|uniref:NADH-quinone oxidoreductase subunit A n=1 Tax=Caldimicrobium thiodismutans TaxID=1653476 RepID=A0A0U5AP43_9BACT|nr:NADH-quinone oxidoreductase subunit A [Caldimicrobium thiodismutans]BAU23666.1 NADH-quinone oxidoreductase [Caldimicrobium thiodismutans]
MGTMLPFLIFAGLVLIIGLAMLLGNKILSVKRPTPEKLIPYECGIDPSGDTKVPFRVKFYLIALIFLIFDVEVVFIYPWAVVFEELAWFGFVEIAIFVILLLGAYLYALNEGALQWE